MLHPALVVPLETHSNGFTVHACNMDSSDISQIYNEIPLLIALQAITTLHAILQHRGVGRNASTKSITYEIKQNDMKSQPQVLKQTVCVYAHIWHTKSTGEEG